VENIQLLREISKFFLATSNKIESSMIDILYQKLGDTKLLELVIIALMDSIDKELFLLIDSLLEDIGIPHDDFFEVLQEEIENELISKFGDKKIPNEDY